jgi:hypothetical protein
MTPGLKLEKYPGQSAASIATEAVMSVSWIDSDNGERIDLAALGCFRGEEEVEVELGLRGFGLLGGETAFGLSPFFRIVMFGLSDIGRERGEMALRFGRQEIG